MIEMQQDSKQAGLAREPSRRRRERDAAKEAGKVVETVQEELEPWEIPREAWIAPELLIYEHDPMSLPAKVC